MIEPYLSLIKFIANCGCVGRGVSCALAARACVCAGSLSLVRTPRARAPCAPCTCGSCAVGIVYVRGLRATRSTHYRRPLAFLGGAKVVVFLSQDVTTHVSCRAKFHTISDTPWGRHAIESSSACLWRVTCALGRVGQPPSCAAHAVSSSASILLSRASRASRLARSEHGAPPRSSALAVPRCPPLTLGTSGLGLGFGFGLGFGLGSGFGLG